MAVYNLIRTKDLAARDGAYAFELYQDAGVGNGALHLKPGAQVRWGARNRRILPPVMESTATLPLWDETLQTQLVAGGDRGHMVRIKKAGALWWTGFPTPDLKSGSTDKLVKGFELKCGDGLHLLKGEDYVDVGDVPFADGDRDTVHQILVDLLSLVGLALEIEVAPRYWPYNIGVATNPLTVLYHDRGRFSKVLDDGTRVARKAYDCLLDVLNTYNLTLLQQNGVWHIVHRLHLFGGTYSYWRYSAAGAELSTGTRDRRVIVTTAQELTRRRKGGSFEDRSPIRSASRTYDHGPLPELLPGGDFEGPNPGTGWSQVDLAGGAPDAFGFQLVPFRDADGVLSQGKAMKIEAVSIPHQAPQSDYTLFVWRYRAFTGPNIPFREGAEIEFNLRAKLAYTTFPDNAMVPRQAFYARQVGGNWLQLDAEGVPYWQAAGGPLWIRMNLIESAWESHSHRIALPAGGGIVKTWLGCAVEGESERPYDSLGQPLGTYRLFTLWDDVHALYIDASVEGDVTSTTWTVRDTGTVSTVDLEPVTVVFGEGPTSENPGAITKADGSLATDWKRGGYAGEGLSGVALEEITAEDEIRAQRLGPRTEHSKFYVPGSEILPLTSLVIAGVAFSGGELVRHIEDGTSEGVFDEIQDSAFVSESDFHQEKNARFYADSGGHSQLYVDKRDADVAFIESAIARTAELLQPNVAYFEIKTGIFDKPLPAFRGGQVVTVVNRANGHRYRFQIRESQVAGDDHLKVSSLEDTGVGITFPEHIWQQSGITATEESVQAAIALTDQALLTSFQGDVIALLDEALDGTARSDFKVTPISVRAPAGAEVVIHRADGSKAKCFVTQNAPKNAKRLHVSQVAPIYDANGALTNQTDVTFTTSLGDGVAFANTHFQSEGLQTKTEFSQVVTRAEFEDLKELVEKDTGPVQELTTALGEAYTVNGNPINFAKRLRQIVPEHGTTLTLHGSQIQQLDDSITLIVAGVDPNTVNLSTIDLRVTDTEASVSSHASILGTNGLTGATNITQRVATDEANLSAEISARTDITTANGLTALTNITSRVATDEANLSAEITARTNITTANGLTAGTNITSRVDDVEGDLSAEITSRTNITTANGLTAATNITQRVDTVGSRVVVQATLNGDGSYTIARLDLEAGTTNGIARLTGDQIELNGNTTINGSFTLNGSALVNGSVTAGKLTVSSLSSITASIGTLTTGVLQSSDWGAGAGMQIDLTNKTIKSGGSSSPKFSVSSTGAVASTDLTITGGSINLNGGVFQVSAAGAVTASNISATGGSISGLSIAGALTMGASGEITNAGADYTLDASGLAILGANAFTASRAVTFGGTGAKLWYNSLFPGGGFRIDTSDPVYIGGSKVWTAGNDGPGSGLDSDTVDTYHAGNNSGQVPISNGSLCTNLNAEKVGGFTSSELFRKSGTELLIPSGVIYDDSVPQAATPTDLYIRADDGGSNYLIPLWET